LTNFIDLTFDGNDSGSALPSAELLSAAVTPKGDDWQASDW
jgi:hypothetical protein